MIGLAPQATIDVYQAPNSRQPDLIDDYTAMVNDPTVNMISTSWGSCEVERIDAAPNREHTVHASR